MTSEAIVAQLRAAAPRAPERLREQVLAAAPDAPLRTPRVSRRLLLVVAPVALAAIVAAAVVDGIVGSGSQPHVAALPIRERANPKLPHAPTVPSRTFRTASGDTTFSSTQLAPAAVPAPGARLTDYQA